ncbi:MAG: NAD(P)/FAD-dependent oxidoreductase [Terriglobia bacterium]
MNLDDQVVILGAGPAGLTAGYELARYGIPACILEQDRIVGGLSRTVNYKGFRFDIGGHRFYTRVDEVLRIWKEILGDNFAECGRLSRIYYRNRFFYYPLRPLNALWGLGPLESCLILLSYLKSQLFPLRPEENFEQWISNRFGHRLFRIFFKTYTEKVLGMPCTEVRAEWAAQRIKSLTLAQAIASVLLPRNGKKQITTLIDKFYYPVHGPGMLWEKLADQLRGQGHQLRLQTEVVRLNHDGRRILSVLIKNPQGDTEEISGSEFISSIPMRGLIRRLDPAAPESVCEAAEGLHYRDFLTVGVIVNRPHLFPDNWIYVHSTDVKVGRIQNYKNWRPEMSGDPAKTNLGLEYFCSRGDELWEKSDDELKDQAKRELHRLGLARPEECEDCIVIRVPKAYPVYDTDYARYFPTVKSYVEKFSNLQLVGRNGQHRYNSQDHSMLTALLAVRNILGEQHDLWSVDTEELNHSEQESPSIALRAEAAYIKAR